MHWACLLPNVPTSSGSPARILRAHVFGLAGAIPESSGIDKYAAPDHRAFVWLCVHDIHSERPDCAKNSVYFSKVTKFRKEAITLFCPNCGTKLPENAKFCSSCGNPVPTIQNSVPIWEKTVQNEPSTDSCSNAEMCRLTIRRRNQFYVYNPAMKVFLDGTKIGDVENGATVTFDVPKGVHTLRVTSCFRKKKITVSFSGDTDLELQWNRLTGGIIVKTPAMVPKQKGHSKQCSGAEGEKAHPSSRKKIAVIGGGVTAAIIVIFVLLAILGSGGDSPIVTVQNGYLGEYTNMTVREMLDGYYGLYEGESRWISGESEDQEGLLIVQAQYTSDLLGTATIQFSMLDKQCFKVSAIEDPMETIEEASDTLALLNKIYITSYETQFEAEEMGAAETDLLERLKAVNATSVRYGASADYTGDRSQLYRLFGEAQLDMSVTELLASYGVIDGVAEYDSVSKWDNDYYNAENGEFISIEWVDNCVYDISSDYFSAESVWIDPNENEVTLFFDSNDGSSITLTFEETGGEKFFDLYTNNSDLLFLNGWYSTIYNDFFSNGSTWSGIYSVDELSDIYGIYCKAGGNSYFSFGVYTAEEGGFILDYYGSDAAAANYVFSVDTPYLNSDNSGNIVYFYDAMGRGLILSVDAPGRIMISLDSDMFEGVSRDELEGTYYMIEPGINVV